jgi:hypothetical protein
MKNLSFALMVTTAFAFTLVPSRASAHFILSSPPSYDNLSTLGDPQKSAPCGQADPGNAPVASNTITAFHPGDTVTITINETVTHPGHYRVALADTQDQLPADPPVTAGSSACGSTTIESPAVLPVLADGMLVHTAAFSGPQTFTVTLPAGKTCTKCTLQVIEFMSNHGLNVPGGCFYHHCADISIAAAATGTGGATGSTGNDGGTDTTSKSGGCSYAGAKRGGSPAGLLIAFAASIVLWRRRAGR